MTAGTGGGSGVRSDALFALFVVRFPLDLPSLSKILEERLKRFTFIGSDLVKSSLSFDPEKCPVYANIHVRRIFEAEAIAALVEKGL